MPRAALASWCLMNLLLVVVPRYGAYMMMVTGSLLLGSALAYHCLLPSTPLSVRFENGSKLEFHLGWCFYLVILAGNRALTQLPSVISPSTLVSTAPVKGCSVVRRSMTSYTDGSQSKWCCSDAQLLHCLIPLIQSVLKVQFSWEWHNWCFWCSVVNIPLTMC